LLVNKNDNARPQCPPYPNDAHLSPSRCFLPPRVSPRATRSRPPRACSSPQVLVLVGSRATWSTPTTGINRPRPSPLLCCKCIFRVFQMFQTYVVIVYMDVAKADQETCTCCKCLRGMLQEFVENVSSVSDVCCKCFIWMLRML
jgi:hypothetical protein